MSQASRFVSVFCVAVYGLLLVVFAASSLHAVQGATRSIRVPGAVIDVSVDSNRSELLEVDLLRWVEASAQGVAAYYGRFPVHRLAVNIRTQKDGDRIHGVAAAGNEMPSIRIDLGQFVSKADLDEDWVMTHEMIHLGFPSIYGRHLWFEEGLATYVEPVVRARAGACSVTRVWKDFLIHLPGSLPTKGSRGIEEASGLEETYWGGSLFWLVADVELRRQTSNRLGLEDVLRRVVDSGGTISEDWSFQEALQACDRVSGLTVFGDTYRRMSVTPIRVDAAKLWSQLGIERHGRQIVFHDDAPLASIRKRITQQEP